MIKSTGKTVPPLFISSLLCKLAYCMCAQTRTAKNFCGKLQLPAKVFIGDGYVGNIDKVGSEHAD